MHRSLMELKRYKGPAEDLGLDFTVESEALGARVSDELIPGGTNIAVTSTRKLQYVYCVADWHVNKRLGLPATAFGHGLSKVSRQGSHVMNNA